MVKLAYIKTTWREHEMSTVDKVDALNHLETQYDEMMNDITTHNHDSRYYTESQADSKYFKADNDGAGSGFVAETLDGMTAQSILSSSVPSGIIAIWSGAVTSIPNGWALCNGQNGTPDLRNKFVVSVGPNHTRGSTGGAATCTPSVTSATINNTTLTVNQIPAHTHTYIDRYNSSSSGSSSGESGAGGSTTTLNRTTGSTGGGQGHNHSVTVACNEYNNLPAYYKLAYIMKL